MSDSVRVALAGNWVLLASRLLELKADKIVDKGRGAGFVTIDMRRILRLDTAGAWLIDSAQVELAVVGVSAAVEKARRAQQILLNEAHNGASIPPTPNVRNPLVELFDELRRSIFRSFHETYLGGAFFGEFVASIGRDQLRPERFRGASLICHVENFGFRSVPIIAPINLPVAAIVTQQGGPTDALWRDKLCSRSRRRPGAAGTRRAADRRNRLDEDGRGNRRPSRDVTVSDRRSDHPALFKHAAVGRQHRLGSLAGDVDRTGVLEQRGGVLFQIGAMLSSLAAKQHIQMPMREIRSLSHRFMNKLAMLKLNLVGLKPDAADKLPSELSGGMVKRAALALDSELVFVDEPTSGLDPIGVVEFDELVETPQRTLGPTDFMVTHDLDSLYSICDRVTAVADGRVVAAGSMETMLPSRHPWLQAYFHGVRGGRLTGAHAKNKDDAWKPAPISR